jgi:hypothetical protein
MAKPLGGSKTDGNMGVNPNLSIETVGNGKFIYSFDSDLNKTEYLTSSSSDGSGVLLAGGNYANPIKTKSFNFNVLADATSSTRVKNGDEATIKERELGQRGGAVWDIVLTSSVTPNTFNIVVSSGDPSLSLVLREVLPLDVRTYGVNDASSDNKAATQQISDNQVLSIMFTPGVYKYLSTVSFNYNVDIMGVGDAVIDGSGGGFSGTDVFKISGDGLFVIPDLNSNVSAGDTSVTFVSPHGLVIGDIFTIINPTDFSFSGFRANYKAGEYCEVDSVTGNTVTLKNSLYDDYTAASVDVYKQLSVTPTVRSLSFLGNVSDNVLSLEFCKDSVIDGVTIRHSNNAAISGFNCYNTTISKPTINNEGDGGDDYGILIGNSQHWINNSGHLYSRRHPVTTGGGAGTAPVPCRDILTIAATLKNDLSSNVHSADFHGNSEDCRYDSCIIYGGATFQGLNNGYNNCKIYSMLNGVCIIASEILKGEHYARGCDLISYADPSASTRGLIDFGGNADAITSNTIGSVNINISDCSAKSSNFGAVTSMLNVRNRGTSQNVNINVTGLTLDVNDFGQVLFLDNISGTAASEYISIDKINTGISGKLLANVDANYLNFPMRMQEFSGKVQVTTPSGGPTVSAPSQVFKWSYPRVPSITMGRTGAGYAGSRLGIPYAATVTASAFTPSLSTDDVVNFGGAVNVDLNWTVSIKEV